MKRIVIAVAVVVLLAVIVAVNVTRSRDKAVEVDLAVVGTEDLVERVSGSGRIEARKSVSITSNVIGKVLEVNAEEGDFVEKGFVILRIDPGERASAVEQAAAALAQAEANSQLAQAEARKADFELKRANGLVTSGLASDQQLQAAETTHAVAKARVIEARERVRGAESGLAQARYQLDKTVVRAEIAGVLVRLSVEEGENVLAGDLYNAGSPIVVIADLSRMEAQILVDETEVVRILKGQEAEVEVDAFPDDKLAGRVVEVGNSAYNAGPLGSQEAKDFRIRILLEDPPENLRPGLSARAEIVTDRRPGALAVPIAALTIRDPEEQAELAKAGKRRVRRTRGGDDDGRKEVEGVFAVHDGQAVFAPVETGIAGEKDFEVVSGLSEGDEIVAGPFEAIRSLESGDAVKAKKTKGSRRDRGRDDADAADDADNVDEADNADEVDAVARDERADPAGGA